MSRKVKMKAHSSPIAGFQCRGKMLAGDHCSSQLFRMSSIQPQYCYLTLFVADKMITMDEFVNRFTKWLDDAKRSMDKEYHSVKSLKDLYQILQPWIQKKIEEHECRTN